MPLLKVIIASTRPGRVGPAVAEWFTGVARDHGGFDIEVVDLAEVNLPFLDEPNHPAMREYTHQHTLDWSATIEAADAFVFVMPEYNFSISAPLKNAIDFLYYEWQYKPVGFVSYGNTSAGLRAVQMTKQVVTTLKMTPLNEAVAIHFIGKSIVDGVFTPTEAQRDAAGAMLDELVRTSQALSSLRTPAAG